VDAAPPEAALASGFDGRASALSAASRSLLAALGLWSDLEADAQPIASMAVSDATSPGPSRPDGVSALLRFSGLSGEPAGEGEPLGHMVENQRLRLALSQALGRSGVRLFAPCAIKAAEVEERCAVIHLADGRRLEGQLLVGADGRSSMIRRSFHIPTQGWSYPQTGVVATVALSRPHGGVAHEIFLPGGPLAVLPLTGNRASLVWTESAAAAEALVEMAPEAFEALLARRLGEDLGWPTLLGPRAKFPLSLQRAESVVAPRVALVGDAAHAVHPIAGQGLNLGLKDAAALAEVASDALRLGEDIGSALVLARYARWRRLDAVTLATATDLFVRLFSARAPGLRRLRGLGLSAVARAPALRRFFLKEASGRLGDAPRLMQGDQPLRS
jgi:2-octaprenyl-6-methoxyphenol hydroxylase